MKFGRRFRVEIWKEVFNPYGQEIPDGNLNPISVQFACLPWSIDSQYNGHYGDEMVHLYTSKI